MPLDEDIDSGQAGHIADHEAIHAAINDLDVTYAARNPYGPASVVGETIPRNTRLGEALSALLSGRLNLYAVRLVAGQTVTSITFISSTTALSSGTNQWFALYSPSRVKLAVTADDTSTAWGASTAKTLALTSPYAVTASGLYYFGICVVASTVPTLMGYSGSGVIANIPPILAGTSTTGLTNPASAPDPAAAITAAGLVPYAYAT